MGGEGSDEVQPEAQVCHIFLLKPSLSRYGNNDVSWYSNYQKILNLIVRDDCSCLCIVRLVPSDYRMLCKYLFSFYLQDLISLLAAVTWLLPLPKALNSTKAAIQGRHDIYIWLESALPSIFLCRMSKTQGQSMCSQSVYFFLVSKFF